MTDNRDETLALQEAYANLYNEIVKPDRIFVASQYFRKNWVPRLGSSMAWVIIALRQHCYWSRESGEKRDWCLISQEELAGEAGISVATLKRLLKREHADKFIIEVTHRYRYDPNKRKQVRKKSRYRIRMDDPLMPEDEALLREKLAQQLAGLKIDPETGQVDMVAVLDKLSHGSLDDLQLNLSDRSNRRDSEIDQVDQSISALAQQISLLLTDSAHTKGTTRPSVTLENIAATKINAAELSEFNLNQDQVLVSWGEDYLAVPMIDLVKRELRASGGQLANHTRTECFFSVAHPFGEGPEEWLPEEEARIALLDRLERELGEQYRELGAFSLEEALRRYFSPDLAADFGTDKSDKELQRIRAWVSYTRQARGLKNPAGFLRSRLESSETAPILERTT